MTDNPMVSIDANALERGVVLKFADGKGAADVQERLLQLAERIAIGLEGFASWANLEIAEKARRVPPDWQSP